MNVRIAKETSDRINKLIETDDLSISIERKKLYVLGDIAVILAGLLDELGADNGQT